MRELLKTLAVCITALGLFVCDSTSESAHAALFKMALTQDGSVGKFSVLEGSAIEIPIYLIQSDGENRLTTQGLFSAGSTLTYLYGGGSAGNASIQSVGLDPIWTNAALNFTTFDNSVGNQFGVLEGLITLPGQTPVTPSVGTDYVLIGSVVFASGVDGNVTDLNLSLDQNSLFINLLFDQSVGIAVEPISFSGGELRTINAAIPEPSSLFIVTALGLGALVTRMNRNRKRQFSERKPLC